MVDMEPKVVNAAMAAAGNECPIWSYGSACSFAQQSGSGNNWARGYYSYGLKFAENAAELVRREVSFT